jgi:hypothetical protein
MIPIEFDCIDCGYHIFAWGSIDNKMERCATCQWIQENKQHLSEKEIAQIRNITDTEIKKD